MDIPEDLGLSAAYQKAHTLATTFVKQCQLWGGAPIFPPPSPFKGRAGVVGVKAL